MERRERECRSECKSGGRRDKGVWERRDEGERSERKGSTEWAKVKRKPGV